MVKELVGSNKLAFMFPGVGSQYCGMGKQLYSDFKVVRDVFEEAGDTLGIDFKDLCFNIDEENRLRLNTLEFSKPALLCLSVAGYRAFLERSGIIPNYCIGYSLGEYSALCCAGAISFADALEIVHQRAKIVKEVSDKINGTMAWVVNIKNDVVENICKNAREKGEVIYISAYDNEEKVSVSGTYDSVKMIAKDVENAGGMVIPIKMSGPYHSVIMNEAAVKLKDVLLKYSFKTPQIEVIANNNALPYEGEKSGIVGSLVSQIVQPVRWRDTILYLLQHGVSTAIEIGPKTVLKYILEMNTKKISCYSIDEIKNLEVLKNKIIVNEQEYQPIIGRCLASAVSTPNYNKNEVDYYEKVVKPYRQIEKIYKKCYSQKITLSNTEFKEILDIFLGMMYAKKLNDEEIQHQINKVLQYKFLI